MWKQNAKTKPQTELELKLPIYGLTHFPSSHLPIYTLVEPPGSAETEGWGMKG